jgi:hypothetical protein
MQDPTRESQEQAGMAPVKGPNAEPISQPTLALKERVRDTLVAYLNARLADSEDVVAVESDGEWRHMVRVAGRAKDFITVWFTIGDRTLSYESYFMPDPEENHESLYRYLLFKNAEMYACRFSLADDRDIFITGQVPLQAVTEDEIDRLLGSIYHYTESYFRTALSIGFASYFEKRRKDRSQESEGSSASDVESEKSDAPPKLRHSL